MSELEAAARLLNLQLHVVEARTSSEFPAAFAAATTKRAGALLPQGGSVYFANRARLVQLAAESRLPALYGVKEYVVAGGLIAYGVDLSDSARRAAGYVDKILKGTKAGDLPIEQPIKFQLFVNLKTAKALGLTIPQSVLIRADFAKLWASAWNRKASLLADRAGPGAARLPAVLRERAAFR